MLVVELLLFVLFVFFSLSKICVLFKYENSYAMKKVSNLILILLAMTSVKGNWNSTLITLFLISSCNSPLILPFKDLFNFTAILEGKKALAGEFPFLAYITNTIVVDNACSGVVLDENWILTVCHCIEPYVSF